MRLRLSLDHYSDYGGCSSRFSVVGDVGTLLSSITSNFVHFLTITNHPFRNEDIVPFDYFVGHLI